MPFEIEMDVGLLRCGTCDSGQNTFNILILAPGNYAARCMFCGWTVTLPDREDNCNVIGRVTMVEKIREKVGVFRRKKLEKTKE